MRRLLEELRTNSQLALKDYGVFIYRDGHVLEKKYFDRRKDAVAFAKSLALADGLCARVWGRTDDFDNRGFTELIWSSCNENKCNENKITDIGKAVLDTIPVMNISKLALSTTPVGALAVKNEKPIKDLVKLTKENWQKLKRKAKKWKN